MPRYTLPLRQINRTMLVRTGGKAAHLGELTGIEGIRVPEGFCVSTDAFQKTYEHHPELQHLLAELAPLRPEDRDRIAALSAQILAAMEETPMPGEIAAEITEQLGRFAPRTAFAVRSSATAEDLPTASFAGQQDSYLNIIGPEAVLRHISKCQASLFTERAVRYRLQNGFDHRNIRLAVVVQQMVFPQASGILFTADPRTGHRKTSSIDAGFGLGEAMVAGLVNADNYTLRDGRITEKRISVKKRVVEALKTGGTTEREIEAEQQSRPALSDAQILALERLGRTIEGHFGRPQDIEWCLAAGEFYIVQSRPITTLYPVPETDEPGNRVYISVAHQQMMTDPMKPLGLSMWQMMAFRPMFPAGGRLFVDITRQLAVPAARNMLLEAMGGHDPLMKDALVTLLERGDFIETLPDDQPPPRPGNSSPGVFPAPFQSLIENDPGITAGLIERSDASVAALRQNIRAQSGPELFDFIVQNIRELKQRLADPQHSNVFMTAINASSWINAAMSEWLGEKNAADTLSLSVPGNVTSEMGLALSDVADAIRPYPDVVACLHKADEKNLWEELLHLAGGQEANDALRTFLDKYGMRCAGEIDITKPRWREKPAALFPIILSNIKNLEPGASSRKFEEGRQAALKKEQELLARLAALPDGARKAAEAERVIRLIRNFIGYREYPKYDIVRHFFEYKLAILQEAERLVQAGIIPQKEDIYYLRFEELHELVRSGTADHRLIDQRKAEHTFQEKLTPPRVLTSDGEIITGAYKRTDLPAGALAGLAVSSGVVEGRARVILNLEDADPAPGDILVTAFTDPSWTPLFVSVKGLVAETGGLMTHGAVIAREYGLPAVVGVEQATRLIKDGQRIRVNGTEGYVEIL